MKRTTFAPMIDAVSLRPADVLDLGCATGRSSPRPPRRGMDVYGVDLNPDAIAIARERVPSATLFAGVLDATVPGMTFDAVTMIDFIEHVRDPEAELRPCTRSRTPAHGS